MSTLVINLPTIGAYSETRISISRSLPGQPQRPSTIYEINIANAPTNLGDQRYARIQLLSHAQMYRTTLREHKIKALFTPLPYPVDVLISLQRTAIKKERELEEFIKILEDSSTRYRI